MKYLRLGRSGLRVSELGLGTWTFGRETSEDDAFAMLDRFAEAAGTSLTPPMPTTKGRRSKSRAVG